MKLVEQTYTKPWFSIISGILAIVADVCGLVSFALGFLKTDVNNFFTHPAFFIILQLTLIVYGNLALAFSYVYFINKIYLQIEEYSPVDVEKTMYLIVYLVWTPAFIIWIATSILIASNDEFLVFISIFALICLPAGGYLISRWGCLLSRTLRPNLPIKIYLTEISFDE